MQCPINHKDGTKCLGELYPRKYKERRSWGPPLLDKYCGCALCDYGMRNRYVGLSE